MTVSDERLAAYADGELNEFEAAQVRRAIGADPALADQLAALEGLKAALAAHYDPILAQPVPAALSDPIEQAAKVTNLSAAREARQRWFSKPVVRYAALPALAASLLIVVFVGRGGESDTAGYAAPQLAAALDGALSGETGRDGTKLLLSFRDSAGSACRAYAGKTGAGIACHGDKGWKLVKTGTAGTRSGSEFQQAGSSAADIMTAAQDMAANGAMEPGEEAAARKGGWAPQK
ncbi:hypothetical protein [Novosphingobium sp.]|uniref:anti-sigma factor family protein n=1 Tax=Novosphingobium sp. TaxID=1874826 RepID=UPI00286BB919|nr:hypothetical protein [Novosphingobium sp.]